MRRLGPAWLALLAAAVIPAAAAVPVLPFDEVRPGMHGTGRTVFAGTEIVTFDVEVLGKLPNVGPDQNLILARLSGGPLAETGVLAGMSGSPVTIDGKLVGAVAYSWGFARAPIAGITPIEEMLSAADLGGGGLRPTAAMRPTERDLVRTYSAGELSSFLRELSGRLLPARALPVSIPLAVSGMDPGGFARAAPEWMRAGFFTVPVGAADEPAPAGARLQPGAAMGLKLVRGDVDMTATGTVTWIDGDRVLAFGHPLFGLGSVDLPLTAARVEALLPSTLQSARIARPLEEVGAIRQDRAAGLVGQLGAEPGMIPVRLELQGADGTEHSFSFDIADDPLLSPLLLYVSLNGVLASKERAFGNATLRLRAGSNIQMQGSEDVTLDNLYAGPTAFEHGTGIAAYILYLLMNNTWTQPRIVGVNLLFDYEESPRLARIRRAALDRYRVAPGEAVEVTVVLSPYRGPDRLLTREIVVPPETPPGPLTVSIGGALALARDDEEFDPPVLPRDLDQLIWLINRLRRNDRVYIQASREDTGVLVGGDRMPNLPPSVARVLTLPRSKGHVTEIPRRSVLEEVVWTDYAVEGYARIQIEVEAR